jgi:hypothetical protein
MNDQSRRVFLKTTIPIGVILLHELVEPTSSIAATQNDWRWCRKCEGLWFNGHPTKGRCPVGGTHENNGSGNYRLNLDEPSTGDQEDWRWCLKCEGLWFSGNPTRGVCPAGGTHDPTGSGNYSLRMSQAAAMQDDWRWCVKCEGLWFNGNPTSGRCPAGGSHKDSKGANYSGNYALSQNS